MSGLTTTCDKIKIAIYASLVIIFTSAQMIVIPLSSERYESLYFTVLLVCFQFVVIAFVAMLSFTKGKPKVPTEKKSVILCGCFGAIMTILYVYSADPNRTPPVLQTILMGIRIIPSVIFTKIILKKSNDYKLKFIIPSLIFLGGSIALAVVPIGSDFSGESALWLVMFILSVICASLYSIYQEKYFIETNDRTLANKMILIFWTRLIQLIIVAACYWTEFIIGHGDHPGDEFRNSSRIFFSGTIDTFILECGIIAYVLGYVASTFLNAISTNFNMIASAGAQPVTILFFTLFSSLNNGIEYPWYISVSCAVASIISVILWMKGESKKPPVPQNTLANYNIINDQSPPPFSHTVVVPQQPHNGGTNYGNINDGDNGNNSMRASLIPFGSNLGTSYGSVYGSNTSGTYGSNTSTTYGSNTSATYGSYSYVSDGMGGGTIMVNIFGNESKKSTKKFDAQSPYDSV